jgi:hypothetical protein
MPVAPSLASFDSRPVHYDPVDIARAGVFVSIGPDGSLSIDRGYVRPEDEAPIESDIELTLPWLRCAWRSQSLDGRQDATSHPPFVPPSPKWARFLPKRSGRVQRQYNLEELIPLSC